MLWSSEPSEGPLKFTNEGFAVHYFRYVFGFDLTGKLKWAYSNPRVELIASEHTGKAILGVSATGEVVALDPKTGAVMMKKSLGTSAQVLGATFDADGWAPGGAEQPVETVAALVQIARDRDARFDRVKELAVAAMAKLPGGEVTKELLAILAESARRRSSRTPSSTCSSSARTRRACPCSPSSSRSTMTTSRRPRPRHSARWRARSPASAARS